MSKNLIIKTMRNIKNHYAKKIHIFLTTKSYFKDNKLNLLQ